MNREDRAKQFAPFEALRGLREALYKKEKEVERLKKLEISEEKIQEIQKVLLKISKGDFVKVNYFENGDYLEKNGRILKKDLSYKYIDVSGQKIFFDDIYEISIKNN